MDKANLPSDAVGYVCVSANVPYEIFENLQMANIHVLSIPCAKNITSPIASHADLIIHHLGNNEFVCEPTLYNFLKKDFANVGIDAVFHKGKNKLKNDYPNDCFYNVARIGDFVFENTKITDKVILDFDDKNYTKKIHINQGYAKCNICVVRENALITSDESVFKAATENGFDVLKIESGHIELNGYDYGFIGGASGLLSRDILAFCGEISHHPDGEKIKSFLRNYNMYPVSLKKGDLIDIGSVLPIAYH